MRIIQYCDSILGHLRSASDIKEDVLNLIREFFHPKKWIISTAKQSETKPALWSVCAQQNPKYINLLMMM